MTITTGTRRGDLLGYDPAAGLLLPLGPWERRQGSLEAADKGLGTPTSVEASIRSGLLPIKDDRGSERTYRLRVEIEGPAPREPWSLLLPVEGKLVRCLIDGQPYATGSRYLAFEGGPTTLDILVEAESGKTGVDSPRISPDFPLLGPTAAFSRFLVIAGGFTFLLAGAFLLGAVSVLILYNLWPKNREFLAFAFLLACEGLRTLVNGVSVLPLGFDLPDRDLLQALAFLLHFLALGWFYTRYLTKSRRPLRWLLLASLSLAAAGEIGFRSSLFALNSGASLAYTGFLLAVTAVLILYSVRGSKKARWLLAGPFFLIATALIRQIWHGDPMSAFLFEPLGLFLFVVATTFGLVRKIRYSFQTSETLTDYVSDVANTVKSFIPQEFLEALDKKNLVDLRLGDHVKKEMTIFFSDIRAFTELSERLTVEENFAFINSYLARVVPVIKENGGFIDKYIGDAIMALFPGTDGPDSAIRSAIEMQAKMTEYNGHRQKSGYRPVQMGIGIHSGSLMLGVVGVADRMENTVISDSVNVASRLQAITKAFNVSLAISEEVFKTVKDPGAYTYRFIGKVKVKGKADPISVFEIFDGIEPGLLERKIKASTFFEQGMLAYYQKDFSGAMYYFNRVLETLPEDGAASFYLETCMRRASL